MIILTKSLSIALSLAMLYHAYLLKKQSGTWLTPAGIWGAGWFALTIVPLVVVPEAPINPLSILYILAMSLVFSVPAFTTRWDKLKAGFVADSIQLYSTSFLRATFFAIAILASFSVAATLYIQGVTFDGLTSDFFATSSAQISDRYTQSTIDTVFAQLANIFTYSSAGIGGLVFYGAQKTWMRILTIALAMAPSMALMAISGAKGTIFLCISIFYGAILAARVRQGGAYLVDKKTIASAIVGALVILPVLTVSFLARGLYGPGAPADITSSLYRLFVSYSSAHVYAFSDWFSWYLNQDSAINYAREDITWGFYTFLSIFRLFGSEKVVPVGFFEEYYQYSWYLQTNIYTVFRGMITDFSLIGSLALMYIFGLAANSFYIFLMRSSNPSVSLTLYMLFCGLVYTSFLISIFVWNSMYPVFFVIVASLKLNNMWVRSARRRIGSVATPAQA